MDSTLIKNPELLICNSNKILEGTSILIEDDEIRDIGGCTELSNDYEVDNVIDASDKIVMPGLVNAHTHSTMAFYRGLGDGMDLMSWLEDLVFPAMKEITSDNSYLFALSSYLEMLSTGTTTFLDNYIYPESLLRAVKDSGMRGVIAYRFADEGDNYPNKSPREALDNAEKLYGEWDGVDERVKVWLGPHSIYKCSLEHLKQISELSRSLDTRITMHISESIEELEYTEERYGDTPVKVLDRENILGSNWLFSHGVHLNQEEVKILSKGKIPLCHNPVSNMKMASGVIPLIELLDNKVQLALGTDSAVSNNNLDMFETMKITSLLHRMNTMNPNILSAEDVFEMATIGGARALGLDDQIGSIEEGKKADIVLLDMNKLRCLSLRKENIISHIIYSTHGEHVDTVMINGEILLREREIMNNDMKDINKKTRNEAEKIIDKLIS